MQCWLQRGWKVKTGNIFRAPFKLHCPEVYSQYLDHGHVWDHAINVCTIEFYKTWENKAFEQQDPEFACSPSQICASIHMFPGITPGVNSVLRFEWPKKVDLKPQQIKFQMTPEGVKHGVSGTGSKNCKLWLLGKGYLRLAMDTELYTRLPGKLMWSGIQYKSREEYIEDKARLWRVSRVGSEDLTTDTEEDDTEDHTQDDGDTDEHSEEDPSNVSERTREWGSVEDVTHLWRHSTLTPGEEYSESEEEGSEDYTQDDDKADGHSDDRSEHDTEEES
jgi:hypothetical protein